MKKLLLTTFAILIGIISYAQIYNINTFAGGSSIDGGDASLASMIYPQAVVIDGAGNMYIVDGQDNKVRKITAAGVISTFAGTGTGGFSGDAGAATLAMLNYPSGIAVDGTGNVYIADQGNQRIRMVNSSGIISTVAGNGSYGYTGDGGPATTATLKSPSGVTVDAGGNIYISDAGNNCIRKVNTGGIISTYAGTGIMDGLAAPSANLNAPAGAVKDASGNVYIADQVNHRIRKVNTSGIISTFAGNGIAGFSGDAGAATSASLNSPAGIAVDASGNVYIADQANYRIRKVNTSGIISTVAGNGGAVFSGDGVAATSSALYYPSGIAVDASGNIYIADIYNNRIRKVNTSGIISTVAGNGIATFGGDAGAATSASLNYPSGVTVDASGNIFIADQNNQRIRKINTSGIISTIAGNGAYNYSGDGLAATSATFKSPRGVTVDGSGNIYIADAGNKRIRIVNSGGIISTFAGGGVGDGLAAISASLDNPMGISMDGTGNLFISDYNNHRIRKVNTSGIISTITGNGIPGFSGDAGTATSAQLAYPIGVKTDGSGNIYIADQSNFRIRKVNTSGIITTIAGNGNWIYSGDGAAATSAGLYPTDVAIDALGNLYIADPQNHRIRKVTTGGIISTYTGGGVGDGLVASSAALLQPCGTVVDGSGNVFIVDQGNNRIRKVSNTGVITTIAGNGIPGFSGDGGAATSASLNIPSGVAIDALGNIYIADRQNLRIRKVNTSGIISTVAGNGGWAYSGDGGAATSASICYPSGVAVDASGNIYIADQYNQRIRKVNTSGIISTVAGNGGAGYSGDGVAATSTSLNQPSSVTVDASGNIYIADQNNNRIRKVNTSGIISTIAGNGSYGFSGDGVAATATSIYYPSGVSLDASGNIYIADYGNNRIRKVNASGIISTIAGNGGWGFSGDGGLATIASFKYLYGVASVDGLGNVYVSDQGNNRVRKLTVCGITVNTQPSTVTQNGCSGFSATALSVSATSLCSGLNYQWYKNTANSNSGGSLISGATSSNYTPVTNIGGTIYYYCIINDGTGASAVKSTVSGAVTVNSPTIICAGNQTANTTSGICSAVVSYSAPTVTGSPLPTVSYSFSGATTGSGSGTGSGSTFNKGVTTVTLTATNSCDASTCSFTVTVNDNQAPVTPTIADATGQCSVIVTAPTTTDACVGTVTGTTSDSLTYNSQGSFIIHWAFADGNGNSTTANQNVIVDDITAPVADLANLPDITSINEVASLTKPTATDNCSGTIIVTNDATLPITAQGTTVVKWTYTDPEGNFSTQNQNVIIDYILAPVATNATNILADGFTTNWNASTGATGYYLDIASDAGFITLVNNSGSGNEDVGAVLTKTIAGLNAGTTYYYRVKAYNAYGTSENSNVITVNTALQNQTIAFNELNANTYGDAPFTVSATGGGSGNPVTFTSQDNTIATCTGTNGSTVTIIKVGAVKIYANQAGNAGYNAATQAEQLLTINAKPVTVTANASQSKVYGSSDPVFTYGVSPALESGDAFTGTLNRAIGENVGTYAINQGTLSAGANYTITFSSNNFGITAKPITVTANTNQSKVYGSANPVYTYGVTPALQSGDAFTGLLNRVAGENVGAYAIGQGTLSAGTNYSITFAAANFGITAKSITVTANANQSKVYGTANPTFTYGVTPALQSGDAFTGTLDRAIGENVGTYAIGQGTLSAGTNYSITFAADNFSITKASPIITWNSPASIDSNTALSGTQLNATADVSGTFAYTPPAGTLMSVGANQDLSVVFTPTVAVNYTSASKTVQITVTLVTGINVLSESTVNVFPNPSSGMIIITGLSEFSKGRSFSLSIIDVSGRTVLIKKVNSDTSSETIDISLLTNGIYFISMQTDIERIVKRFVKQ